MEAHMPKFGHGFHEFFLKHNTGKNIVMTIL